MAHLNEFDFVVVGTGSGGGTTINRLVNAGFSVLALESGIDMPTPEDRRREINQMFVDDEVAKDWHFSSESEVTGYDTTLGTGDGTYRTGTSDQSMGRMVGGSSMHYGMINIRGDVADYDEWNHIFQQDIAALTAAVSITWNGTLTVTGTGTAFLTELAPGDFISRTDASGAAIDAQPYEIDAIASDISLTILNPQGLTPPTGVGGILNSPWNRASMLKHYRAIDFDIDFDISDTVNHGGSNTAFSEVGRIGGPAIGDNRGLTTSRVNPVHDDMTISMRDTVLGTGGWDYIDDRNVWGDFAPTNDKDVWKAVLSYVGFDSATNPVAGGRGTAGSEHLNPYDERRSMLQTTIDSVRANPLLTLSDRSTVDRLLLEDDGGGLRVTGVVYFKEERGILVKKTVYNRNVIVCCGPWGTPPIFLRSGIGAIDRLAPHGIVQILNSPGVGADVLQHSGASIAYLVNEGDKQPDIYHSFTYSCRFRASAGLTGGGGRSTTYAVGSPALAFEAMPHTTIFTGGGRTSDLGLVGSAGAGVGLGTKQGVRNGQSGVYFGAAFLMKPRSRGDGVRLRSTNPFDIPFIREGLISDPASFDAEMILEAIADLDAALQDPAGPFAARIAVAFPFATTVLQLHGSVNGAFHACSTMKMGHDGDPRAVCDAQGRVRLNPGAGALVVRGLRVSDNSIYPTHVVANNHTPTCAHANLIADMLIADGPVPL